VFNVSEPNRSSDWLRHCVAARQQTR